MKLNNETLQLIPLFENITKVNVKDCFFYKDKIIFIVGEGQIIKAIGKNGVNIKKLENGFKKRVKLVELSNDVTKFIRSFLFPVKTEEIKEENNIILIKINGTREKGLVIGRDRQNLKDLKEIVGKYFKVNDIKVV